MKIIRIYESNFGGQFEIFGVRLPGCGESTIVLPGQKLVIEATEAFGICPYSDVGLYRVTVSRYTQEGYTARPDEWWPET